MQFGAPLRTLSQLKAEQHKLSLAHGEMVPMAIKVAPDMAADDIEDVASALLEFEVDGLIATNTTIELPLPAMTTHSNEAGGLSGKPLADKSTAVVNAFHQNLADKIPIIGVGEWIQLYQHKLN